MLCCVDRRECFRMYFSILDQIIYAQNIVLLLTGCIHSKNGMTHPPFSVSDNITDDDVLGTQHKIDFSKERFPSWPFYMHGVDRTRKASKKQSHSSLSLSLIGFTLTLPLSLSLSHTPATIALASITRNRNNHGVQLDQSRTKDP